MPGATISSRDWSQCQENLVADYNLGTTNLEQKLLTPLRGISSFSATFRVMFKEEFRKNIEFAKTRQIILFPLLLALVTMVSTIGLQFLVGDSAAQTSDTESKVSHGRNYDSLYTFLCLCLVLVWGLLRLWAERH